MGLLFLILAFLLGYYLITDFLKPKKPVIIFSGSILVGILLSGTILYLLDLLCVYLFRNYHLSNYIYSIIVIIYLLLGLKRRIPLTNMKKDILNLFKDRPAIIFFMIFLIFSTWLNYHTFFIQNGDIGIAGGAWSDIMYHNAYVRTVSTGLNVPVDYPYITNIPIHYHFMFDYYAGKIAQVGLGSVHALNILSIIGMTILLLLIFEFGRTYLKSPVSGALGAFFLIFHSSLSVFGWINENKGNGILSKALAKTGWLQSAAFESWGLFNLNVYINRRNFAFSLAIVVFIVICVVGYRSKCLSEKCDTTGNTPYRSISKRNIFLAIIIGALPFWNVIAAGICIIFTGAFALTAVKNRKFMFSMLYTAIISGIIVLPQVISFKTGDTVLQEYPKLHLGFAVEDFSVLNLAIYYFNVLGLKIILILLSFFLLKSLKKLDFLIFLIPFILANTIQFGKILYDNNQLIILWLVFMNCFAAFVIVRIFKILPKALKFIPIVLIIVLSLAGILDFISVKNIGIVNIADNSSDLKQWIESNTRPQSVFLTDSFIPYSDNSITTVSLSGRRIYAVKNDVDSSCNLDSHLNNIQKIYSYNGDIDNLKALLKSEKIDYIIIDNLVRTSKVYTVNEDYYKNNLDLIYNKNEVSIFAVMK